MPISSFDFSEFLNIVSICFGCFVLIVLSICGIIAFFENKKNKFKYIRYLIFLKDKLIIFNPYIDDCFLFIDKDRFIFYYESNCTYKILKKDFFN